MQKKIQKKNFSLQEGGSLKIKRFLPWLAESVLRDDDYAIATDQKYASISPEQLIQLLIVAATESNVSYRVIARVYWERDD